MGRFALVVLVAAALGGLASLGIVDALQQQHSMTIGGVTVPVTVEQRIYDVAQLRIAAFSSSFVAAVVAIGLALALDVRRRRR